uniref:Uncharacterized protein n=1 Tax=Tanacetum cinerariifolium TaxID=118510 RepID=A0A6L2KBH7_TANCI|nr:hypothetical protein [Tanacetum cinerariifolium]
MGAIVRLDGATPQAKDGAILAVDVTPKLSRAMFWKHLITASAIVVAICYGCSSLRLDNTIKFCDFLEIGHDMRDRLIGHGVGYIGEQQRRGGRLIPSERLLATFYLEAIIGSPRLPYLMGSAPFAVKSSNIQCDLLILSDSIMNNSNTPDDTYQTPIMKPSKHLFATKVKGVWEREMDEGETTRLANNITQVAADGPVLSNSDGHTVEKVMVGHDKLHDENPGQTPSNSTANPNKGTSYANLFTGEPSRKSVDFRTLITSTGNGIDVVVLMESIRAISERVINTTYGSFLGKHVTYPVVANYFSSMNGLDSMLENGPWFIHNNPFILKKWNLNVNLLKEDVVNVLVWVKLHGVPVTTFREDGLIGSSYAKAMIELRANVELKDTIVVAMPKLVEEGFYTCIFRIEYEWKPPRCACCKFFGHVQDECPKNIGSDVVNNLKKPSQAPRSVQVGPKVGFKPVKQVYRHVSKKNNVNTSNSNPIDVLNSVENDIDLGSNDGNSNLASKKANSSGPRSGMYGTNSLLEQWTKTYENDDYDYDLYDDNMYEGHDIPDKIQSIWDNLDIKVRDRKK